MGALTIGSGVSGRLESGVPSSVLLGDSTCAFRLCEFSGIELSIIGHGSTGERVYSVSVESLGCLDSSVHWAHGCIMT